MHKIYHTWIHPLYCSPLSPNLQNHEVVSTGIIFAFTCTYTPFFCTVFTLLLPFPNTSLLFLVPVLSPGQDWFYLSVVQFCKRRDKMKTITF
jgi:hypothetical protein